MLLLYIFWEGHGIGEQEPSPIAIIAKAGGYLPLPEPPGRGEGMSKEDTEIILTSTQLLDDIFIVIATGKCRRFAETKELIDLRIIAKEVADRGTTHGSDACFWVGFPQTGQNGGSHNHIADSVRHPDNNITKFHAF